MQFGNFELDQANNELRRAGILIKLTPQQFRLLRYMATNAGRVLTREEIQREIWGDDTFVDFQRNLNVCVAQLRAALNDDSEAPRFIQTVPRRGYRFVAPVVAPLAAPAEVSEPSTPKPWPVRRLAAIGFACLCCAFVGYLLASRRPPAVPRIAILPFESLDRNPADDPLLDGVTEDLISGIGSLPLRISVIGRGSVMRYKNSSPGLDRVGRDLNVDYVVEGTLRRSGQQTRLTSRLVRVADQVQVWTETFEQENVAPFELEQQAVARVTAGLLSTLFPTSKIELERPTSVSAGAYESYLKGRYLLLKDVQRSVPYLQAATQAMPSFAAAHTTLATAYLSMGRSGKAPPDIFVEARKSAEAALRLDANDAEAHNALANALFWHDWDWPRAKREFLEALRLNPSYALAHHDYSFYQVAMGRTDEGVASLRRAIALEPLSPHVNIDGGWLLLQAHRYDDAIRQARRALELEPGMAEAQACIARAEDLRRGGTPQDKAVTLDKLEKAYVERRPMMAMINSDPSYIGLRAEPRFQSLLKKLGFQ